MRRSSYKIPIGKIELSVNFQTSMRAKRLSLKLDPYKDQAVVTTPFGVDETTAKKFLDRHIIWLEHKLIQRGQKISFHAGTTLPVLGIDMTISYEQKDQPRVTSEANKILVEGFDPVVVPGLVKDWLRKKVYEELSFHSQEYAGKLDQKIKSITLKEMKSRWGSCSHNGRLNYNWRLVFAPIETLKYVCAHEIAHLLEMNHSPAFWKIVEELYPSYELQRKWLKKYGSRLFLYG